MKILKRAAQAWDQFFFSPLDLLPSACMRITLGLLMTVSLIVNSPNWHRNMAIDAMGGPWNASPWWDLFSWTHGKISVEFFGWASVLLAISYTLGRHAKWCAALLLFLLTAMFRRNWFTSNAEDTMFRMYMFYSLFLPVGAALSVDRVTAQTKTLWCWPARMVQIHLMLIYLISTPTKWMSDLTWRNGEAMYYVIINPMWSRWPWPSLFYSTWVTKLTTYGSLLTEGSSPFLIWIPKFRKYVVCSMIAFHFALAVMLQNITFFSLSMIPGLLLFFTDEEIRSFLRLCHLPVPPEPDIPSTVYSAETLEQEDWE